MDAGVEATQERLPEPGKSEEGGLLFTPGILPFALRASFAVRAAGARKLLLQGRSEMSWMAISKRLLPAKGGRSVQLL
jgi:hypothetical protein